MNEYNKAGEPEHTPLSPGRDKPLRARDVHVECRARMAELEAELERLDSFDVGLDAALAKLKERHAILQSRFDQEKAAHESLQAELAALKVQRCTNCGVWFRCWIQDASVSGYGEERPDDVWCEQWVERGT